VFLICGQRKSKEHRLKPVPLKTFARLKADATHATFLIYAGSKRRTG